ncbi:MAG TPA: SprT family zinc-dependent metalloprotease [Rhizomicrobium sp.]|nr:SprT family zinc-dependent metalloprotease [Rhizomicrobium sp.]
MPVTLRLNPRARRVIVKVHPATGEVTVVAPTRRGLEHALDFARGEKDWIARQRARVPAPVPLVPGARLPFRGQHHEIRHGGANGPSPVRHDAESRILWVYGRDEHMARRLADFLKREARALCEARALEYAAQLGVAPARITLRDTSSRWGSCSAARVISFSWRLIFAPDFVRDYVVAHEVAHLREMNHGPRFWKLVEKLHPEMRTAQAWLRTHGRSLQRYAPKN